MSEVHFFQRFSQRENVATNNTLLLLSRLYEYDRRIFQAVLTECLSRDIRIGVSFEQQTRSNAKTVPDGMFWQQAFKIVVETKMGSDWRPEQIKGHLSALEGKEEVRLLLLLSPSPLSDVAKHAVSQIISDHGKGVNLVGLTFGELITTIRDSLKERDNEMVDIIDDYEGFAGEANLLPQTSNLLRVVPCGLTWEENEQLSLYYEPADRGALPHAYLGIYAQKYVRLIGEVSKTVLASVRNASTKPEVSAKNLSPEEKSKIIEAWLGAEKHGWVSPEPRKFTFVKRFYRTSFQKTSSGGMRKHRNFNLKQLLGDEFKDGMDVREIASKLMGLTWD
jgi:hypothetical protein